MPHILIQGHDDNLQLKTMQVHIQLDFAKETFHSARFKIKMDEIRAKFEAIVEEYFNPIESDQLTNHEYNLMQRS